MLNLFIKPYCPYCARVIAANETIKAPVEWLDITSNSHIKADLLDKGGKTQVPFLEDTEKGVMMYESDDIIAYLHAHYGRGTEPNVPKAGNVCPIE